MKTKSVPLAIILNVLIPGAGYLYFGRILLGLAAFAITTFACLTFGLLAFVPVWVMANIGMAIDMLILSRKREREDIARYTKKCPSCAERIQREAKVCRYCGTKFTLAVVEQKRGNAMKSVTSMLICVVTIACSMALLAGCGSAKAAGTNDPPATDLTNCKLTTTGSNINLVCDGTVISSVTIPTGTTPWQPYTNGTRLQVTSDPGETWLGTDGAKYSTADSQSSFYDTQLGVNCSLGLGSDGQKYCLPDQYASLYGVGILYADSSCSNPVAAYRTVCGATAPNYIKVQSTTTCGPTINTMYQLGNHITTVYYMANTTCTAQPDTFLPAGYQFAQVGAEVPVSTFVAFTKQ